MARKYKKWTLIVLSLIMTISIVYVIAHVSYKSPNESCFADMAQYDEDISIYVDFGKSSAYPRFFVYDNNKKELISKSKCAHGVGGGSTVSKPVFSNVSGSNCSSLGVYRLTVNSRTYNYNVPCIRLKGLNASNSNAENRGIVIHPVTLLADDISIGIPIPVSKMISQGCFAISRKTFYLLQELIQQNNTIYLYAECNASN